MSVVIETVHGEATVVCIAENADGQMELILEVDA
tara:strand:+ start:489 stop:590 length:102 start_codon:yes stop_codon:yes gene_type:complete